MNSSRMMFRLLLPGALIFAALLLVAGTPGAAQACPAGFTDAGTECQLSGPLTVSGTLTFEKTLHLLAGANLDGLGPIELDITGDLIMDPGTVIRNNDDGDNPAPCGTGGGNGPPTGNNACNIIIVVSGSVDMGAGSIIEAENQVDGGIGGNITMTIGGDLTLHGPGDGFANGALISTRNSGSDGGAGNIRIKVGNVFVNSDDTITCDAAPAGSIVMESGSIVTADAVHGGEAGSIKMFAGRDVTINGRVSSRGFTTTGRGGPITIDACCNLTVGPTGVVSSRGQDPGADLVHLQGCDVLIQGLVESTGAGHENPNGANLCNDGTHTPGPISSFFTGCVEIWGGDKVTIDRTPGNNGEVNADIGFTGGTGGQGWIDIFAHNLIQVFGATSGTIFAVHANGGLNQNTDDGGIITIKAGPDATDPGLITMTGLAVQADAISAGSDGGSITVEGNGNVTLNTASLFARGDFVATGGFGAGGHISVRSFNGTLSWQNGVGNVQPTGATIPAAQRGVITLQGCGTAAPGDGVNTSGTLFPSTGAATTPTVLADACGGQPVFLGPAATQFEISLANGGPLVANCTTRCVPARENKLGRKFNDRSTIGLEDPSDPGLVGWRIDLFDGSGNFLDFTTTTAGPPIGHYGFSLTPGTYTVCEVLQSGWVQTAPGNINHPFPNPSTDCIQTGETIANCSLLTDPAGFTLGAKGYTFTVTDSITLTCNDFGNVPVVTCPEDPNRAALLTRIVDNTLAPHGAVPVYATLQDAYDAAGNTGEVIGMFSKTVENVVLGGAKTLTITQCTNASITAAAPDPNSLGPVVVVDITSTGKLTIISPDTHGGDIGWRVGGNGSHDLKSIRANGASQFGVQILSNNNSVSGNDIGGNGFGLPGNGGAGLLVQGSGNTLKPGTVDNNTGDGVRITGNNNTLSGAKVQSNSGNGVAVSGTGNTIKSNNVSKNGLAGILATGAGTNKFGSNVASSDTGFEWSFSKAETATDTNNSSNGTKISATKCPTLFSAGGTCE